MGAVSTSLFVRRRPNRPGLRGETFEMRVVVLSEATDLLFLTYSGSFAAPTTSPVDIREK
jgi:hypothetical protein